jgi:hypothetical protein
MNRLSLPDLLKGFAVFLIVPVHILEKFIDYPGRESMFGKTLLLLGGPVAVPVFMMVMGYFVAGSSRGLIGNILRGVFLIVLGLLLNIGLNLHLLLKIWKDGWNFDPLQAIFGVDILFLAGLSIIILSFLNRIKIGQKWIVAALILFVSAGTSYINEWLMVTDRNYLLPLIGGTYSWSYFPLFPWLVYPLVGFLFRKLESRLRELDRQNKRASIFVLVMVLIPVLLFSSFGINYSINLPQYYHHTFWFFIWTMGVNILWLFLLRYISQKSGESPVLGFLRWLGQNITLLYVFQWLIIGNIATSIYQSQGLGSFGYWFGIIFSATIGLTILYRILSGLVKRRIEKTFGNRITQGNGIYVA